MLKRSVGEPRNFFFKLSLKVYHQIKLKVIRKASFVRVTGTCLSCKVSTHEDVCHMEPCEFCTLPSKP